MYKWFVHGNSPDGWECVEPRYVLRPQVESLHFTCGEIGSDESAIEVVQISPIDQSPFYGTDTRITWITRTESFPNFYVIAAG